VSSPLPSPLRLISIGAMGLAAFVVLASWLDLLQSFSPINTSEIRHVALQQESLFSKLYKKEAPVSAEALVSFFEAYQSGLNEMRLLRAFILFGLSICATSLFMSGWRLVFKRGPPRPPMARRLSKMALACAIFRTLDGAQSAALARRSGAAFDALFKANASQSMETSLATFSVVFTFFVVALFLWIWRYFQAPKTLASLETPPLPPPPT